MRPEYIIVDEIGPGVVAIEIVRGEFGEPVARASFQSYEWREMRIDPPHCEFGPPNVAFMYAYNLHRENAADLTQIVVKIEDISLWNSEWGELTISPLPTSGSKCQ